MVTLFIITGCSKAIPNTPTEVTDEVNKEPQILEEVFEYEHPLKTHDLTEDRLEFLKRVGIIDTELAIDDFSKNIDVNEAFALASGLAGSIHKNNSSEYEETDIGSFLIDVTGLLNYNVKKSDVIKLSKKLNLIDYNTDTSQILTYETAIDIIYEASFVPIYKEHTDEIINTDDVIALEEIEVDITKPIPIDIESAYDGGKRVMGELKESFNYKEDILVEESEEFVPEGKGTFIVSNESNIYDKVLNIARQITDFYTVRIELEEFKLVPLSIDYMTYDVDEDIIRAYIKFDVTGKGVSKTITQSIFIRVDEPSHTIYPYNGVVIRSQLAAAVLKEDNTELTIYSDEDNTVFEKRNNADELIEEYYIKEVGTVRDIQIFVTELYEKED